MRTTMRIKRNLAITFGAMLLTAGVCAAQNESARSTPQQPKYFHLDFAVKELDGGKVINSRHYSMTTTTGESAPNGCMIRTGSKVPVSSGGATGNFTYIDVGVNIDCRSAKEIDGSLATSVTADISNTAPGSNPPLIRQTKWSSHVIVPIGKPTIIFSSDDVTSKGQMQLELTATPIR
jgi:hypothetical protein